MQHINTATDDGKVSIGGYRNTAISVFKDSMSKPEETLRWVVFGKTISYIDVSDAVAVGRRKNGIVDFAIVFDRYFFRQYQNVDVAKLFLAQ
jgi:hypothetical protein